MVLIGVALGIRLWVKKKVESKHNAAPVSKTKFLTVKVSFSCTDSIIFLSEVGM
jgi:hypothetical protein